jgi:hypothetical protein
MEISQDRLKLLILFTSLLTILCPLSNQDLETFLRDTQSHATTTSVSLGSMTLFKPRW